MRRAALSCLAVALGIALASDADARQAVNLRAEVLSQFQKRVDAYLELREKASAGVKKLEETKNPEEVTARQQALGRAIKAARPHARRGEIFFPEVAALVREAVREDFRRRPAAERSAAFASVPNAPKLGINDYYPSAVPLATVPPRLLAQLPRLPEELEYRFLGARLILRDVDANLVVDFLDNALPPGSGQGGSGEHW